MDADANLWRYALTGPERTPSSWSPKTQIGRGWGGFGRVLGGPGGRLYGIDAQGVTRYRYLGASWDASWRITNSWTSFATAANRNKITIDETGDFYLIDGTGRLLRSRYDEGSKRWTTYNQVLASGWDNYNLIVAGTAGTLYARDAQGRLFRSRYDSGTQRWLEQEQLVGAGWNTFSRGIMSAGGDTLFGITAAGAIQQYRFREDTSTWAVAGVKIGTGWQSFSNVTAATDTCKLTANRSPARPNVPVTADAPVAAVQLGADSQSPGPLHFSFTRDDGSLLHGSSWPSDPNGIEWTPVGGTGDYRGEPVLLADTAKQTVQTFVHRANGDLTTSTTSANTLTDLGGAMIATPTAIRLTNGELALFGVAADGTFWHRRTDDYTGELLPWVRLGGSALNGTLAAVAVLDDAVQLLAIDSSSGAMVTARYRDGALESPWASLGGGSFVGAPATLRLPGSRVLVVGRSVDGDLFTQTVGTDGRFPGTWQRIGDASVRGTGAPAIAMIDRTASLMVFSRVGDALYYHQGRFTGQDSLDWGPARPATPAGQVQSDPTALEYQDGADNGYFRTGFVVRNAAGGVSLWTLTLPDAKAKGGKSPAEPRFTERAFPKSR